MTTNNTPVPSRVRREELVLGGRVGNRLRGLPGVAVTLTDHAGVQVDLTSTGAEGGFEFSGLTHGTYLAIFSHHSYQPHATVVSLSSAAAPLDVTLEPATSVRGTVSGRHTGRPVAAATVTAVGPQGEVLTSTVSEPDGRYGISGIDAAELTLVVTAPGADPVATTVQCGTGTDHEIDVALEIYSTLSGTVTKAGEPVADLPLTLRDRDGLVTATAITDSRGGYRFDRIQPGRYTVDSPTRSQAVPVTAETTTATVFLSSVHSGVSRR